MLCPRACSFVCLAGTCLQARYVNILADLTRRDSHSPAECFLMKDSHSPAEYIQMRLSLFQGSHILSKAHLNAFSMLQKPYSRRNAFSPQLNHDEWCLIPQLALNEDPCLNTSFPPSRELSLPNRLTCFPQESHLIPQWSCLNRRFLC